MGGHNKKIHSKKPKKPPLTFISRDEWGAESIKGKVTNLKHPVQFIRYGYTGTVTCRSQPKCSSVLQEYQEIFLSRKYADQPFNFLIASDGVVYEGRGWDLDADRAEKIQRKIKGNAIDIGFIGDFSDESPPDKMIQTGEELVEMALEEGYLQPCPKILNLNDYQPIFED